MKTIANTTGKTVFYIMCLSSLAIKTITNAIGRKAFGITVMSGFTVFFLVFGINPAFAADNHEEAAGPATEVAYFDEASYTGVAPSPVEMIVSVRADDTAETAPQPLPLTEAVSHSAHAAEASETASQPASPIESIPQGHEDEYVSLGVFKVTHYCACTICTPGLGLTASGEPVSVGMIAADTSVIPMHTTVYLGDSKAEYVVKDTGSAIKGNRIDIYMATHQEALNAGVYNVELFVKN